MKPSALRLLAACALVFLLAGCGPRGVEMMQVPPAGLRGAAWVADVDLSLGGSARARVPAADARLARKPLGAAAQEYARMPFSAMFTRVMKDVAQARGLASGRALRIAVEMDRVEVPDVGMAALGRRDRLAGLVKLLDAHDGELLASFYVDVQKVHPGLIGMVLRGTGVREKLAGEFARRVADQLAARR